MYTTNIKNEKLLDAILGLSFKSSFYYDILLSCSFRERESPNFIAAIAINKKAGFTFYYNPDFIDSCTSKQIEFLIIHEIQHILSNHLLRVTYMGLDRYLSNIAQDMIINSNIKKYFKDLEQPTAIIDNKKENLGYFVPDEYEEEWISEILYDWLKKNKPEMGQSKIFKISLNGKEKEGKGNVDGKGNAYIDSEESKKENDIEDEVSSDLKEAIIQDVINQARNRGLVASNEEETLRSLRRSKKNYLSMIKAHMSIMFGNMKQSTWKKFSRKYDLAPGFHRIKNELNCILDTSGSMNGMFEKVLSYIFYHNISINMIQCDAQVQSIIQCKSLSDIQKLKIKGHGGTTLQPAIDYIKERSKINSLPLVILTDGYCDTLDFTGIKNKVLGITVGCDIPITGSKNIKMIKVEK